MRRARGELTGAAFPPNASLLRTRGPPHSPLRMVMQDVQARLWGSCLKSRQLEEMS